MQGTYLCKAPAQSMEEKRVRQSGSDLFSDALDSVSLDAYNASIHGADEIYVKKLALNDWQWTEDRDKHQGGIYIPHEDRDSGFFPKLERMERRSGEAIHEVLFKIHWPQVDTSSQSRLVHYTSKGQETHLTRVPKAPFSGIAPASYLVMARRASEGRSTFQAFVVDSTSDECASLIDMFEIKPDFRSGRFVPKKATETRQDWVLKFAEEALEAFQAGELEAFATRYDSMPTTKDMAARARAIYRERHPEVMDFNPLTLPAPGDVTRELSRDIEYALFREYEVSQRSLALVKVILGTDSNSITIADALRSIIRNYREIDDVCLSAAQQRKSRAGYSFEHHIKQLLVDGNVPHEEQVIIAAKKRPDFVLPTRALYLDEKRPHDHALVLSVKTTLRERWKQVKGEIKNCRLFLATVDENIAENAIEDMKANEITLVVPESLKKSDVTVYKAAVNVISFRDFFVDEIARKRSPIWLSLGIKA